MRTTIASLLTVYGFAVWSAQALPHRPNVHNGARHESEVGSRSEWNQYTRSMSDRMKTTPTPSTTMSTSATTSEAVSATSAPAGSAVLSNCAASLDGQLPYQTPSNFDFSGNVRRFYVAAEEVEWHYAPSGWDNWLGVSHVKEMAVRGTR